jgi:hypothetical protein
MLLLFATAPAFSQGAGEANVGVDIQPTAFKFSAKQGETVVQPVTISNNQAVSVQLSFYLGDWLRDSTGNHKYFPPGTLPISCANWVKLSRNFLEIPPHSKGTFDLTLSMPDSAAAVEAMRWAMLFVEFVQETEAPVASGNQRITTTVRKQRIGLHIYEEPPTLTEKAFHMTSFHVLDSVKNIYRMSCINNGKTPISCKPMLQLTPLDASSDNIKIDGREFPMFPGQKRIVDIAVPEHTPKGRYNVMALLDAGEDLPLEAAQAEIFVR